MTQLEKLKIDFLEHLEIEKNRSLLTVRNYDHYLSRFLMFAKEQKVTTPSRLDLDLVRRFRLWLNRLPELKLVTQNYHLIALRSFLKYLVKRDVKTLAAEKIELARIPQRQVAFLESEDLEKLLAAPTQEKHELRRLRDIAILELLFSTGLRVAEAANLKRKQINLKKEEFSVTGKGRKIRIVFLSRRARDAVKKYLEKRHDNSEALFIKHPAQRGESHAQAASIDLDNKPLTPRSIQRLIKKYCLLSGISINVTPHTLRHTMATDLLEAGADLRSVQEILGHASITTTQIYTHVTNKRLKEIHQKYHGRFRNNR